MKKIMLCTFFTMFVSVLAFGMDDWKSVIFIRSDCSPIGRDDSAVIYQDYLDNFDEYEKTRQVDPQKMYISINTQDEWGDTQLHKAVESKNIPDIQDLLFRGARCDITNALGESPLSLVFSMHIEERVALKKCFKDQGCFFVNHGQVYNKNIPYLLQHNAEYFFNVTENMNVSEHMSDMMFLFHKLFTKASSNEKRSDFSNGYIVSLQNVDCFVRVKLSDLYQLYKQDVVNNVFSTVLTYFVVPEFLVHCDNGTYEEAKELLKSYPLLYRDERFNRYIMFQLLSNITKECWKFLLGVGFNPNCSHPLLCTILHQAAHLLNEHALYYLVYSGANCSKRNAQYKTSMDILFDYTDDLKTKDSAMSSLSVVVKAIHDRYMWLVLHNSKGTFSQEIQNLNSLEDLIRRFIQNKKTR